VMAQPLRGVDGVVIGYGYQLHSAALQGRVDFVGIAVALPADPLKDRNRAHAGVHRVDVQIAFHAFL
jgi:hypothetical protein